jgi:hypothetical protein
MGGVCFMMWKRIMNPVALVALTFRAHMLMKESASGKHWFNESVLLPSVGSPTPGQNHNTWMQHHPILS